MLRSLKCQRRRKHIGKKTWSVTIVIFVRTGRQDWTQSVITSENSYSFMIFQPGVQQTVFDSQQLQRTFWLSRTLPSNFSTKRLAKNSESKAEGKWRRHSNWKKETRGHHFLDISRLQANLAVLSKRGQHRKPRPKNCLNRNMGLLSRIHQRPKSEQQWQVVSFNPNATATAIEQPPAAFGPGIAQEWCVRSPNRCTNYTIWGFGSMNIKIYLRMNSTINATLLHALMRLVDQIAGNWSCGMAFVRLMGQLRGVC